MWAMNYSVVAPLDGWQVVPFWLDWPGHCSKPCWSDVGEGNESRDKMPKPVSGRLRCGAAADLNETVLLKREAFGPLVLEQQSEFLC
jgi:hypothetical protein